MATHWSVWCTLLAVTRAQPSWPWKPREFASLWTTICMNVSHVCDPDNILSNEETIQLTQQLDVDESQCRLNIGIALTQQTFHQKRDQSLDVFADEVREKWRLSECQNDLVLFLSNDSQTVGFSLGNGSQTVFGSTFDELSLTLKKEFEMKNSFFEYLSDATRRLTSLHEQKLKESQSEHWSVIWNALLTTGYLLVILVIIGIACYYCCYRKVEKQQKDVTSVVSSEMTTKYSELKPTIEMSERSTN